MESVGKKQLIQIYSKQYGVSLTEADLVLTQVFGLVHGLITSLESVRLTGIGTLYTIKRKSRRRVNNLTGEAIVIPEKYYLRFRPIRGFASRLVTPKKKQRRKKR